MALACYCTNQENCWYDFSDSSKMIFYSDKMASECENCLQILIDELKQIPFDKYAYTLMKINYIIKFLARSEKGAQLLIKYQYHEIAIKILQQVQNNEVRKIVLITLRNLLYNKQGSVLQDKDNFIVVLNRILTTSPECAIAALEVILEAIKNSVMVEKLIQQRNFISTLIDLLQQDCTDKKENIGLRVLFVFNNLIVQNPEMIQKVIIGSKLMNICATSVLDSKIDVKKYRASLCKCLELVNNIQKDKTSGIDYLINSGVLKSCADLMRNSRSSDIKNMAKCILMIVQLQKHENGKNFLLFEERITFPEEEIIKAEKTFTDLLEK